MSLKLKDSNGNWVKVPIGVAQNGWTPQISIVPDGPNREVQRITGWVQSPAPPPVGKYIGAAGFVDNIADATNLKGTNGVNGGGNAVTLIEVTETNLYTLISSSTLVLGALYKITGFNKNKIEGTPDNPNGNLPEYLYDDGTNSGITIYAHAITSNKLSSTGWGEFYNPKYTGANEYENTDGTGLYQIWDGENPDFSGSYEQDQVVFWGGYAWRNLNGNVGSDNNVTSLDEEWEKIPYSNTTYYNKVVDEIKIDWNNKIIVGRTNVENQITVEFNADQYENWMENYSGEKVNPIAVMGWGIYSQVTPEGNDNELYGISNVRVINSVCETVNFKGIYFINNIFENSYLVDNYFGSGSSFDSNTLTIYSRFSNAELTNDSSFQNSFFISTQINNIYLTNNSSFNSNKFTRSLIYNLNTNQSQINSNNFDDAVLDFLNSGSINNKQITFCKFNNINQIISNPIDLSSSTLIFDITLLKHIYSRPDGSIKLSYMNNSDTLVVADITD